MIERIGARDRKANVRAGRTTSAKQRDVSAKESPFLVHLLLRLLFRFLFAF